MNTYLIALNTKQLNIITIGVSLLLGIAVFLFYFLRYPQALSYQEQYQLFLLTGEYFVNNIKNVGGLAEYLGEFVIQFGYVEWAGALFVGAVFALLNFVIAKSYSNPFLSLAPCALLLWHLGDENVLFTFVIAIFLSVSLYLVMRRTHILYDAVTVPLLYWCVGPCVWIYVLLRFILSDDKRKLWIWSALSCIYIVAIHLLAAYTILDQQPMMSVMSGTNYFREPFSVPDLQYIIPGVIVILAFLSQYIEKLNKYVSYSICLILSAVLFYYADSQGYDKDKYEMMRQDYLVRNERWDEVVRNAEEYQVPANFSSECVNLSLAMTGQLAKRMFTFYQSGGDALFMPMVRDLTSNLPTMEAFYRLGMINESLRYACDMQESILNGKKSGRLCKRIAECYIIKGEYQIAAKYLNLLKQSLYYREWAEEAEAYLGDEARINNHPQWGKLRANRFNFDFLFYYDDMYLVLGHLFNSNKNNKMALEYFFGQLLLIGKADIFMEYLEWAQQYGGYSSMPQGYADAYRCIQSGGDVIGSSYGEYVRRIAQEAGLGR